MTINIYKPSSGYQITNQHCIIGYKIDVVPQVDPPLSSGCKPRTSVIGFWRLAAMIWSHVISWELVNKSVACTKISCCNTVHTILGLFKQKSVPFYGIYESTFLLLNMGPVDLTNRVPLTWGFLAMYIRVFSIIAKRSGLSVAQRMFQTLDGDPSEQQDGMSWCTSFWRWKSNILTEIVIENI